MLPVGSGEYEHTYAEWVLPKLQYERGGYELSQEEVSRPADCAFFQIYDEAKLSERLAYLVLYPIG